MKKRKIRRYRSGKRNSGMKFLGFIGIIIGAVICGYLTARFIVAPLLGYETEVLKLDFPSKFTSFVDEEKSNQKGSENGKADEDTDVSQDDKVKMTESPSQPECYVLQFGVFSSESGAKDLVKSLKKDSVETQIKQIDGKYKVLSESYESKEEALKALETLKQKKNIDVFITVIK